MPLRRNARACIALVALLAAGGNAHALEPAAPVKPGAAPTTDQIRVAAAEVRQDPDMGSERKARTLKWKTGKQTVAEGESAFLRWLQEFFRWIGRSARVLVWVLAALLAALVVVYALRLLRARSAGPATDSFTAPSHVQDLDIRPESLPDDIGAAAQQLWDRGEQRRALALLYRGLLSRMVHAHRVPVRDSTTEGECIALVRRCLPEAAREFSASLVSTWQRAVYGELMPPGDQVRSLCAGFAPALDAPRPGTAET